uniref:Suppressor of forked domain-containing protein n=1 Tax=Ixodes ricinus TaxID=34613 RepID=A0A6B0UTZ6_IXORI
MFAGGGKRETTANMALMEGYIPDRVKNAEKRLEQNVYDIEAWSILLRDAQNKKMEDARPLYEKIVTQFPNAGRYWKIYIEHEVLYQSHFSLSLSFYPYLFSTARGMTCVSLAASNCELSVCVRWSCGRTCIVASVNTVSLRRL